MARNIDTYDDDEENEDEKPVERPRPRAVPPPPPDAPTAVPVPPPPAVPAEEEKPMSPIEEVLHRAGPRAGGKIFPFKRKIAGMGGPIGPAPSPVVTGRVEVPSDVRLAPPAAPPMPSEPEVIVVPVAPTPPPANPIVGFVMGLVAVGGAVFLASLLSGTGEMGEADDEEDDDEEDGDDDLSGSDDGDSELERALAAPIEVAAPPKPKRRKKAAKLEEDVIEGEIVEDENAA